MQRRFALFLLVAIALALLVSSRPATAQNRAVEAQARALQKKAMEEDYLTVDFDKAAEKLTSAISKCGTDKCANSLRALLRRDLATVASAAGKKDDALVIMIDALKIDPSIQLDPNFKTKELEAIYAEAKKSGGGAAAGGGPSPAGGSPAGDFTHTPVAEQAVRTPVPIYVEYGGSEQLVKVIVRYKGYGMTEFKTLDLKKVGNGWGATVPCTDVQQGDFLYYIQGFNANNDPVATAGDRNKPYKVPIKGQIAGEAPHLPGQPPPTQCADTGDCPPDFPGCKKVAVGPAEGAGKAAGESCEEDVECASSKCQDKQCTGEKVEEAPVGPKHRRFWVGGMLSLDFPFLPSSDNVCAIDTNPANLDPNSAKPTNTAGYYCVDQNGNDYPLRSDNGNQAKALVLNKSDKVSGGAAPGNFRVLLTFDYALTANILLGVRVGYNIGTYPGSAAGLDGKTFFAPLHLEARGTYIIGKDGVDAKGLKPYVFFGVGATEFDAKVDVTVFEQGPPGGCGCSKTVSAWNIGGPFFVAPGGGARYAFSPRAALMGGLRLGFAFGSNGLLFVPAPELGFQYGF